ncbi:LOW QUALITY PROTEIN: tubulin polyglutamylase TTLL6 [Cariama cristata]
MAVSKITHFPGRSEICRKYLLARNRSRVIKLFPEEFNFFLSVCLQSKTFLKKHKIYICKLDSGCQGRGVFITKSEKDIKPGQDMIQLYVSRPFILGRFKFGLRIYVLMTSRDPLRIFVYESLTHFAASASSDLWHNSLCDQDHVEKKGGG